MTTWGTRAEGSGARARRTRGGVVVAALGASFGLVVGLAHCASPTEIVVEVWSDACGPNTQVGFTGGSSLAELRTRELTSASPPGSCPLASGSPQRVGRMVLSPSGERDATVAFEVVTRPDGLDPSSCGRPSTEGCIVSRRQLPFVPRSTVTMRVDLRAACVGVVCGEAETCVRGSCERADTRCEGTCDEEQLVSAPPAVASDASVESPPQDADASRIPVSFDRRRIEQIVAGANHTCVRWSDDAVTCWGLNSLGQSDALPSDGPRMPSVVYQAPAGTKLVTIGAGGSFSCVALSAAPGVQCWGDLKGSTPSAPGAVRTIEAGPFSVTLLAKELALGNAHACALDATGQLWCWGESGQGQYVANPTQAGSGRPWLQDGFPPVSMLASSPIADFTCGVQEGKVVRCLGPAPASMGGWSLPLPAQAFGLSPTLSCVTTAGGAKSCVPSRTLSLEGATVAWAGGAVLCHLDTNGVVECFASPGLSLAPRTIPGARLLAVGARHQCVVVGAAEVRCWGENRLGQVTGLATGSPMPDPVVVPLGRP